MFNHGKIKELRDSKKWSLADVIFRLAKEGKRCTRQTILNWETGVTAPKVSDIACLAELFNVKVQYFFEK